MVEVLVGTTTRTLGRCVPIKITQQFQGTAELWVNKFESLTLD